jgi:hypothetical protein
MTEAVSANDRQQLERLALTDWPRLRAQTINALARLSVILIWRRRSVVPARMGVAEMAGNQGPVESCDCCLERCTGGRLGHGRSDVVHVRVRLASAVPSTSS